MRILERDAKRLLKRDGSLQMLLGKFVNAFAGSTVRFMCPGSMNGHIHRMKEKDCLSSPTPSRGPGTGQPAAELRCEIPLARSESAG